jgi:hypothetical protein
MADERRKHARYDNEQLSLNVARPGIRGILKINPTAECLDFSRTGLQFECDQTLAIADRVILDLLVYDIELDEIYGEIVSQKPLPNGHCCHGVRFCFDDKRMQHKDITHKLLMIEDRLRTAAQYPQES